MYASTIITAVLALSSATLAYPRFWKPDSASDNGDLLNKRTVVIGTVTDVTRVYGPPPSPTTARSNPATANKTPTLPTTRAAATLKVTQPPPASPATPAPSAASSGDSLDPSVILAVMPSASSCSNSPVASECATASDAAPHIAAGWTKYNITAKAAQAATLALMAYESAEFKYNVAHFNSPPPGKGTRNMQSPNFNIKYAASLFGSQASSDPATALNSVLPDAYTFASASWFLATQCPSVLEQFATDPASAWTAYLGPTCIDTSDNAQRDAYYSAAQKALGA